MSKITVTMPIEEYEEMKTQIATMTKALDDKSVVIARYHGYKYHMVNPTEKLKEIVSTIERQGISLGIQNK